MRMVEADNGGNEFLTKGVDFLESIYDESVFNRT